MCVYYRQGRHNIRQGFVQLNSDGGLKQRQLTHQFNVSRIRARGHWGFRTRLSNKFGGFTLGCLYGTQRRCLRINKSNYSISTKS